MADPIARELDLRRQKLLDLTRRNRLLNFRPSRRTTLRILDEVPSELLRLVALEGKTLGFLPQEASDPSLAETVADVPEQVQPEPPTIRIEPLPGFLRSSPGEASDDPLPAVKPTKPTKPTKLKGDAGDPSPPEVAARTLPSAEDLGVAFKRPRGRCPFCHDAVSADDASAVCNACLSRLHLECWDELGRCASCGGSHALTAADTTPPAVAEARAAAAAPAPTPQHESSTYQRIPREKLPERHRDLYLQTTASPSDLEKNLLAIHRAAQSTFEEQGFASLFLALGFLEWTEKGSKKLQRAPILLVPVELKRRTVRSKFKLSAGDNDPLLNPALAYKLEREWGIDLGQLPDDSEELDPDDVYEALANKVAELPGWRVSNESALALFSFTKFVMYKDLQTHEAQVVGHPVVRRLLGAPEPLSAADAAGTAASRFCVMDADASQRGAIEAVLAGQSLVLEGPPGTGKSQTITNLIACFLAAGKRVLFVSEKMAALEVVQSRLEDAGLGEFCLELHSRHSNKRAVVKNLARTLELAEPPDHDEDAALEKLLELGDDLNALVGELHEPWGALAASPYQAIGAFEEVRDLGGVDPEDYLADLAGSETAWSAADLETREQALATLGRHVAQTGDPRTHPCRGVRLKELTHTGKADLTRALEELTETALPAAQSACAALTAELGGTPPPSTAAARLALRGAELLLDPDLPPADVLANPAWDGAPPRAAELLELLERRRTLTDRLAPSFRPELPDQETLLAMVAGVESTYRSWYRIFLPSYHEVKNQVAAIAVDGYDPDPSVLVRDLTLAAQAVGLDAKLAAADADGRALYGNAWPGERAALERVGELAQGFRRALRLGYLQLTCLERIRAGALDPQRLRAAMADASSKLTALDAAWERFAKAAAFQDEAAFGRARDDASFALVLERLGELRANVGELAAWVELSSSLGACEDLGLKAYVARALAAGLPTEQLPRVLRRAFLMRWLDAALAERRKLATFKRIQHEQTLEAFRRLDARQLRLARVRLRHRLAARRPDASWEASDGSELGILQRELRRKRGHMPVRQLLRRIPTAVAALKPCLLMSPLTVAQFTEPGLHTFDLVLFDEASQIAPEDALGAIARGKQVVVVGDSKQMPPTAFFQAGGDDDDATPDLESILDECVARGMPRKVLRWHYRSRHESLIAFSNHHFYERSLHTFPSPDDGRGRLGLQLRRVEGAVYERGGSGRNRVETEAVADAIIAHFKRTPERSLGVGTFSQAQQEAILDAVERRLRSEPDLEPLFSREEEEHFFVKNLENIQGDERDVIFVSVGYGPDANGKLHLNFGPLNQTGGERRLNVLVTRARQRLVVFTSFRPDQLDLARTSSVGVHLLRAYLEFIESRRLPPGPPAPSLATGLEQHSVKESLAEALRAKQHEVTVDVGTSAVRVDLAIRQDERHALGILVDGPRYAAFEHARDRDRILPAVLEGLRWDVLRVWSMEWHRHPRRVLKAVKAALADAQAGAAAAVEEEEPAEIALKATRADTGAGRTRVYRATTVLKRGSAAEFKKTSTIDVAAVVAEVVRTEGPIHEEEAQRRALAHWELSRSGKRARQRIEEAAAHAISEGSIKKSGAFYWPSDLEAPPVRDRSQAGPREIELIAPEEIAAALTLVAEKEIRIATEDLIKRAAKLLGFTRAGAKVQRSVGAVLAGLIAEGKLSEEHGVVNWTAAGSAD